MLAINLNEVEQKVTEVMDLVEGFSFMHGRGVVETPEDESIRRQKILLKGGQERRCEFCSLQKCLVF